MFEDLDVFTHQEFSTIAQVDSATAVLIELSGIFDENYQDMFSGFGNQGSEGRNFCFKVQTSFTDGLKRGDRLTINGKTYQIVSLQPMHDGKLTNIILKQDFS